MLRAGTAFEAVELRGFAFASFARLACIQKADQFFSPCQKRALVFIRLHTVLDPSQHGVLMNAEQLGDFLHGIGPRRLDPAYVVNAFASAHGETQAVMTMPLWRALANDSVPVPQIKVFFWHTLAFRPPSALAMLSAVIVGLAVCTFFLRLLRVSPRLPEVVPSKHVGRPRAEGCGDHVLRRAARPT
jgi:hypothetical protein